MSRDGVTAHLDPGTVALHAIGADEHVEDDPLWAELERPPVGVIRGLVTEYRRVLGGADGDRAYFLAHLARHCADAGPDGVDLLRELAAEHPEAQPQLTTALRMLGGQQAVRGAGADAISTRREVTQRPRQTPAEAADAQHALALSLWDRGSLTDATVAMERAFLHYEEAAAEKSWFDRKVALTLLQLAHLHETTGQRRTAVVTARLAAEAFANLADADHRFREEAEISRRELNRLRLVRARLAPRRRHTARG